MRYPTREAYEAALEERGGLPEGFRVSTAGLSFRPAELDAARPYAMNLSLIQVDRPASAFGAVYTRNAFPGAPVLVGRARMREPRIRGILVNNRIANVAAPGGAEAIDRILEALARRAGGTPGEYIPASTGIIGWRLPVDEMVGALPGLVEGLGGGSVVPIARSIMTTDSYPKVRSAAVGEGRIVAIAKGAGMIEPDMATMLCFVLTDCRVEREALREMLSTAVEESFNRVSVDGDQSTSDSVIAVSSGARAPVDPHRFEAALREVCGGLAEDVVRNGEGTGHVIRVVVRGAPHARIARGAGKALVNSPLVKTAICANDPNVGRLAAALGDYLGRETPALEGRAVTIRLCGETVFRGGCFLLDPGRERRLAAALSAASMPTRKTWPLHEERVEIEVDLGSGSEQCAVLGADLSEDYVRENTGYRS